MRSECVVVVSDGDAFTCPRHDQLVTDEGQVGTTEGHMTSGEANGHGQWAHKREADGHDEWARRVSTQARLATYLDKPRLELVV